MRISDWSSDVCSSDLGRHAVSPVRWVGVRRGSSALRALPQSHMERCFVNGTMVGQRPSSDAARAFSSTSAIVPPVTQLPPTPRSSEEHTSELQSLMRTSYAVFCLKNQKSTSISQILNINFSKYNHN